MSADGAAVVLVVEDEEALCDVFAGWLGERYTVKRATTGEDALRTVGPATDVVTLDLTLPDMSGIDVLRRMRSRGLDCPVALVTAHRPDVDVIDEPFDYYLTKPATHRDLHHVVERLIKRREYDEDLRRFLAVESKLAVLPEGTEAHARLRERRSALLRELNRSSR